MTMQQQHLADGPVVPVPDPWSGWSQVYELPASVEYDLDEEAQSPPAPSVAPEPGPASPPTPGCRVPLPS